MGVEFQTYVLSHIPTRKHHGVLNQENALENTVPKLSDWKYVWRKSLKRTSLRIWKSNHFLRARARAHTHTHTHTHTAFSSSQICWAQLTTLNCIEALSACSNMFDCHGTYCCISSCSWSTCEICAAFRFLVTDVHYFVLHPKTSPKNSSGQRLMSVSLK